MNQTQKENLSSYLYRGRENNPNGNTKRGKRTCVPLPSIVRFEISHVSVDDHFAALQIDFAFEGGLRGFGGTAACTFTISSRTMSVQLKEIPLPSKRTPFIILLSLRKSKRRGNSPSAPDISNLQHHIAVYVQQEFYAETSMCCQQVKVSSTADERNLCCR